MTLKIECNECRECSVFFDKEGQNPPGMYGECRLNPPAPISAHSSAYPVVRSTNPGCSCGSRHKPKPKARKKCTKPTANGS